MQNAQALRDKLFTMRMSAEEWERAVKLANYEGVTTVAALLRMLLMRQERHVERERQESARPRRVNRSRKR